MKKSNYYFVVKLSTLLFAFTLSMRASNGNIGWSAKYENQKNFIENKSQFHIYNSKEPVLYAYDGGSTMIYFTSKGVTYSFLNRWKKEEKSDKKERERENLKSGKSHVEMEAEEHKMEFETDVVNSIWENSNPNVEVIALDQTEDYHSYTIKDKDGGVKNINYIKGFKKLIYKNLYPNIDVEYIFHPKDGIKYSIILHPGADISLVKMKYNDQVKLEKNGDLHIPTLFGDLVDKAPSTFYSENKSKIISSHFVKTGSIISFELGTYDHSKTIIVDPWVHTPTLPNSNCVWECEKDGAGNAYIIGGDSPLKLLKYNAAGALQWTYNTPYDSTNSWLGTFATDLAGNSFVTMGSTAQICKVNTSGTMLWNYGPSVSLVEYWNITFNCDQTKLIIGGMAMQGLSNPLGVIFDINTTNGNTISTQYVGLGGFSFSGPQQEVRSISSSRNAKYYFLTFDTVGYISQDFSTCTTTPVVKINNGYSLGYKCENYHFAGDNAGIMAIRANKNFVYTQNGTTIQKRSLTTLAVISSATIPGGTNVSSGGRNQVGNSGIDIDSCGNVYVGSGNAVVKYDANLNLITSAATSFRVYDVAVSYGGNVIAAGTTGNDASSSRTGYIQSFNMSSCNPMTLFCCDATVCPVGPFCTSNAPVTLTPVTPGGTWSGTGVNPTTGVFDPAAAGPGTHMIAYNLSCGSDTIAIVVSPCLTLTACQETNGNITVTNGTGPYTWYKDSAYTNCSACPFGMCAPPICNGVPGTISTIFATGVTATPPGTYPIHVTDANSTSLIITSLASLPNCSSNCPPLTVAPSSIVMDSCFGQSNGSFSASTSGGVSPWSYVLKNSGGVTVATFNNIAGTQSFTGLAADTYTLNVVDNNNCPGTTTITITQPNATTIATAGPDQSGCSNSTILAGNTPTVGTGMWTIVSGTGTITTPTSPTSGVTGLGIGTTVFQWTISNAPCPSPSDQVSITNTGGGPTVTIASQTNISCYDGHNGSITATATGGTGNLTYSWSNGGGNTLIANNLSTGTYTITVTDSLGCTGAATDSITQPSAITANVTTTPAACGSNTGSATTTASGGTGNLTYSWSNGGATTSTINTIAAGTYSVTVTDSLNCTKTVSGIVATTGGPTASAGSNVTIIAGSTTQLTASGGGTYFWTPPTGLNCDTCRSTIASPAQTISYCVTVSLGGCSDSACVTVTVTDTLPTAVQCGTVYVPSAFTPSNNDLLNDTFKPVTSCVHDYSFIIFNRWGEKIFETSDTTEGWSGYYKNQMSKQDVYIYKITFIDDQKNDFHQFVGYLTLLR